MTVSNIYRLLDKMEMILLKGKTIPFTPWVFIHQDKVLDLLDKVRASIPGEIQDANVIIKRRDDIQREAHNQAEQILNEAGSKAHKMLEESEVLKAVKAEAEKIREEVIAECRAMKKQAEADVEESRIQAINEAISIREGADRYAESILNRLDADLGELTEIVDNGQKQLSKLKADSLAKIAHYKGLLSKTNLPPQEEIVEDEEVLAE